MYKCQLWIAFDFYHAEHSWAVPQPMYHFARKLFRGYYCNLVEITHDDVCMLYARVYEFTRAF